VQGHGARALGARAGGAAVGCGGTTAATVTTYTCSQGWKKTRVLKKPSPVVLGFLFFFCFFFVFFGVWGFFWVFWVFFSILAQKRGFLRFFQFQEYF
jgi:hypothetical protein